MSKTVFLPDLLPCWGKQMFLLSPPPPLIRKPLLPQYPAFTPQPRLIGRLIPLLSIPTSRHSSTQSTPSSYSYSDFLSCSNCSYSSFTSSSNLAHTPPTSSDPPVGASNPPTPPPSSSPQTQLNTGSILQLSCNGILHCMQESSSLLPSKNILIACIQEYKLIPTKNLPTNFFPN